jgi:hypothetical protein
VPSLIVGVLWIVAVVDARNQLGQMTGTLAQLAAPLLAEPVEVAGAVPFHGGCFGGPDVEPNVRKFGEHRFSISRAVLESFLGDLGRLPHQTRVVTEIRDGRATGFRLYSVQPDSPLERWGFRNGDVIRSINGFDIGSPEMALEAYAWLKTSSAFLVVLDRDGERITNSYRIH